MKRYQPHETLGFWTILDRETLERLNPEGVTRANAHALSDLLNSLDAQQNWASEAARWSETRVA